MDSRSPELLSVEDSPMAQAASKRRMVKDSEKSYLLPDKLELTIKSLGYTENIIDEKPTGYASLKFQCEAKDKVSYEIYLSSLVKIRKEFNEVTGKETEFTYPEEFTLNSKLAQLVEQLATKKNGKVNEGDVETAINGTSTIKKQFINKTIVVGIITYRGLNKRNELQDIKINAYKFK